MPRVLAAVLAIWLAAPWPVSAQSAPPASRAEALDAQRAQREQSLGTEPHNWLERSLFFVEEKHVIERLNPPEGFYPRLGSLTTGSGVAVGAGYRDRLAGGRALFDTSAAWTYRGYKTAQARVALRASPEHPLELSAGSVWYDYTQQDFFGLGRQTDRNDRVSYRLEGFDTYVQAQARRAGWLVARGRVGVQHATVHAGEDRAFPSVEELFSDATAPGLAAPLNLAYAEASGGVDTRDQPGNTRGGGLYRVSVGLFRNRSGDDFDFNRVDLTALHVIPIFDKKRGIALHAVASRIDPVGSARVPFYLMPTVGGGDSLRGFRDFRFRDAAAVNLNAEYRWEAFSGLDLALFVDAGDVGPTWRSLVAANLKTAWGGGFRFNTNRRVFLRIDIAGGREGTRVWAKLGPVFNR